MSQPDNHRRPMVNIVLERFMENHAAIIRRQDSEFYPQLVSVGNWIEDERSANGRGIEYSVTYDGFNVEKHGIIYYGEDGRGRAEY